MQADPADVVSYASVSYIKKTSSKARVRCLIGSTGVGSERMGQDYEPTGVLAAWGEATQWRFLAKC